MSTFEEIFGERKRLQESQQQHRNLDYIKKTGDLSEQDPVLLTLIDIRNALDEIRDNLAFRKLDGKLYGSRFTIPASAGIYYIDFVNTNDTSSNIASGTVLNIPFKKVYAITIEVESGGSIKIQTNDPAADDRDATLRINAGTPFSITSAPAPEPKFRGISMICDTGTSAVVNLGLLT